MNVDRLDCERALVAEHLHPVHQFADAIGFRTDELCQGAILIRNPLLQKLGRAADARKRVLDLMGQNRGKP